MNYPSIFNDVIGPVMRGPSSSHCAASLRIGRLCRDLMDGNIEDVLVKFDPDGSLATTHESQGADMGLFSGLLGRDADDERLPDYEQAIKKAGVNIKIEIADIDAAHPNTYKITLKNNKEIRTLTALSIGGGMIEVIEIDGARVSITGDFCETLVYVKSAGEALKLIEESFEYDELKLHQGTTQFVEIKSQQFYGEDFGSQLLALDEALFIRKLSPVLPILSRKNLEIPFITCEEMLEYNKEKSLELWELAVHYESVRGNITQDEVYKKMREIVRIMQASINQGLQGTEYKDRILGCQSVNFKRQMQNNRLIAGEALNRIIMYVTSMMETKSSMGVIVAAPTAGSCGALPGAVLGTASALNFSEDTCVKAMLAAGMIGVFISAHATFAAEVGGCQAECGSASGMAAAAIVTLTNGTLKQTLSAASMALQNSFGMVCDPVANRVEAPCLGKNVMAAVNALSCANMALAAYDPLIPLDEVIAAMDEVGKSLPNELRCTALGGLSITKTSKAIAAKLNKR